MRLDRASPRERRPPRNRVPQAPGNDRAPPGLPVVAAAGAVAAAVVLEVGRGPPGSASLPLPGRPGQRRRRRRLLLPLLPAPPRLMPRPGRQSPGACSLMPHRSPGSHRSLSRARAPVTPTTTGWRRASTGTPVSRHLRPRTPRALGPAGPQIDPGPKPHSWWGLSATEHGNVLSHQAPSSPARHTGRSLSSLCWQQTRSSKSVCVPPRSPAHPRP